MACGLRLFVDDRVLRNRALRTMSGGEPSSIKQIARCVVRVPAPRKGGGFPHTHPLDFEVYDLILYLAFFVRGRADVSDIIPQMAPENLFGCCRAGSCYSRASV